MPAAASSTQKAKPDPTHALSTIASFDRKPAKPYCVNGMPTPLAASVPIIIVQ